MVVAVDRTALVVVAIGIVGFQGSGMLALPLWLHRSLDLSLGRDRQSGKTDSSVQADYFVGF